MTTSFSHSHNNRRSLLLKFLQDPNNSFPLRVKFLLLQKAIGQDFSVAELQVEEVIDPNPVQEIGRELAIFLLLT
jgi:hypothetical protein